MRVRYFKLQKEIPYFFTKNLFEDFSKCLNRHPIRLFKHELTIPFPKDCTR